MSNNKYDVDYEAPDMNEATEEEMEAEQERMQAEINADLDALYSNQARHGH